MKTTTLKVNRKGCSYGFRRGNTYFTKEDVYTYDQIIAIKGRGVTKDCEEKIRAKFSKVIIQFQDDERRI